MRSVRGQAIVEYTLLLTLVALACVAAMSPLGQAIQAGLQGMVNGIAGGNGGGLIAAAPGGGGGPLTPASGGGTGGSTTDGGGTTTPTSSGGSTYVSPPPTPYQDRVCLASGMCVNVPRVENGPPTDTTGSNGGQLTSSFANVLDQVAEQLKQDPNTDPKILDIVTRLASQGHAVAAAEIGSDIAVAENCPNSICTLDKLTAVTNARAGVDTTTNAFSSLQAELYNYLSMNPGALPPAFQNVINQSGNNIVSAATPFRDTMFSGVYEGGTFLGYGVISGEEAMKAITLTKMDSNTICGSGGDTSVCVQ